MKCQHHRYTVYLPMCCMHTHSSDKKSKKEQDSSHHHYQESVFKPSQMILLRLRMHSLGFSQNNLVGYLQRKKKKKKKQGRRLTTLMLPTPARLPLRKQIYNNKLKGNCTKMAYVKQFASFKSQLYFIFQLMW